MMAEYLAITYRCVVKFPVSDTCVTSVATPIQQGPLVLFYRKEIPGDKTCTGQVLGLVPHENKKQRIRPRKPRSLSAGLEALKQCRKIMLVCRQIMLCR